MVIDLYVARSHHRKFNKDDVEMIAGILLTICASNLIYCLYKFWYDEFGDGHYETYKDYYDKMETMLNEKN